MHVVIAVLVLLRGGDRGTNNNVRARGPSRIALKRSQPCREAEESVSYDAQPDGIAAIERTGCLLERGSSDES